MKEKIMDLIIEEQGQGMTEYGLVLSVIVVAVVGMLFDISDSIINMFTAVNNELEKTT